MLWTICLPKLRPILIGMLYWLSEKPEFIEDLSNSLKEHNISNTQECYLIGHLNVNMLSGSKMLVKEIIFSLLCAASFNNEKNM